MRSLPQKQTREQYSSNKGVDGNLGSHAHPRIRHILRNSNSIQTKQNNHQTDYYSHENILPSNGQALSTDSRSFFEPRFSQDFSQVKIHTGDTATKMAQQLSAKAFTIDQHIVFNSGTYQPNSHEGKQLLAHELTHVVQQNDIQQKNQHSQGLIQRKPIPKQSVETFSEQIQRLLSELNYYVDNNQLAEAKKRVAKLKELSFGPMSFMYGLEIATAFFRLGLTQDAFQALDKYRSEHKSVIFNPSALREGAKLLFAEGNKSFKASAYDKAFTIYEKLFTWLEGWGTNSSAGGFSLNDFPKAMYPKLLKQLFAIPEHFKKQGKKAKADKYYQKIKDKVIKSPLTAFLGISTAQAFIDADLDASAFEVLDDANKEFVPQRRGYEYVYPMQTVNLLIKNAKKAIVGKNWDKARLLFLKALDWLRSKRKELDNFFYNLGEKRTFIERSVYDVMDGLLTIVDQHIDRAEVAFKAGAKDASKLAKKAQEQVNKLMTDLKNVAAYSAIVAKIDHKKPEDDKAVYHDAHNPKIKMQVGAYRGDSQEHSVLGKKFLFKDRKRRIETILSTKTNQLTSLEGFYVADKLIAEAFHKKHGRQPDIHNIKDRRLFWDLKYDHLIANGKSREQAIQALVTSIGSYLTAFTLHTKYNIPDTKIDALTAKYPKAITQQALIDCGVYAMGTAFELSMIRKKANLDFYFVFIPNHVYLGVIDKALKFGWGLSNNVFSKIKPSSRIASAGVGFSIGRMHGAIPSPLKEKKLTSLSQSGLRKQLIAPREDDFLPPNFKKLNHKDRKKAQEKADELRSEYLVILKATAAQSRLSSHVVSKIKMKHEELKNKKAKEPDKAKAGFKKETIVEINKLFPVYERLSDVTRSYFLKLIAVKNNNTQLFTDSGHPYFTNMFMLMRYLVHELGDETHKDNPHVKGNILKNANVSYKGKPPPWDNWVFDFSED